MYALRYRIHCIDAENDIILTGTHGGDVISFPFRSNQFDDISLCLKSYIIELKNVYSMRQHLLTLSTFILGTVKYKS